jgi:hypothetical protein
MKLAVPVLVLAAVLTLACESPQETAEQKAPDPSFLYDYQSLCIFDASMSCHGNPIFPWENDTGGGGTWTQYNSVCDDNDPMCMVRGMNAMELIRFNRLVDSIATLHPSCQYARTWLQNRLAAGRIWVYDYENGESADVHWAGPNDTMARLHIWWYTWAYSTREFLRTLIHEAAHVSLGRGDTGPNSAEAEAIRCVP